MNFHLEYMNYENMKEDWKGMIKYGSNKAV